MEVPVRHLCAVEASQPEEANTGKSLEMIFGYFGFSGMLQIEHYLRSFAISEVYIGYMYTVYTIKDV